MDIELSKAIKIIWIPTLQNSSYDYAVGFGNIMSTILGLCFIVVQNVRHLGNIPVKRLNQ